MASFRRSIRKHFFNPKKDPPNKDNIEEYPVLSSIPSNEDVIEALKKASKSTMAEKSHNVESN